MAELFGHSFEIAPELSHLKCGRYHIYNDIIFIIIIIEFGFQSIGFEKAVSPVYEPSPQGFLLFDAF